MSDVSDNGMAAIGGDLAEDDRHDFAKVQSFELASKSGWTEGDLVLSPGMGNAFSQRGSQVVARVLR